MAVSRKCRLHWLTAHLNSFLTPRGSRTEIGCSNQRRPRRGLPEIYGRRTDLLQPLRSLAGGHLGLAAGHDAALDAGNTRGPRLHSAMLPGVTSLDRSNRRP